MIVLKDKNSMRDIYKKIRKNILNKKIKDEQIFLNVINNEQIKNANTILIYASINDEVDTLKLIQYFLRTKKVGVPKIINDEMKFYFIKNFNELKKGYFSILEPITTNEVVDLNDVVCIVPGICFDSNKYRIGYGKGFYDKYFDKNNVYSIGLCYKECLVDKIQTNKNDKKVNEIITDL